MKPVFRFLLFGTVTALLFACKDSDSGERPANLLPDEVFVDILVDLSLAESAATLNVKQVKHTQIDSAYSFDPISERNIRKSQYDSTLMYYASHIDEYKLIYENVLGKLSILQANTPPADTAKVSK